jgi:hypothetical protein
VRKLIVVYFLIPSRLIDMLIILQRLALVDVALLALIVFRFTLPKRLSLETRPGLLG